MIEDFASNNPAIINQLIESEFTFYLSDERYWKLPTDPAIWIFLHEIEKTGSLPTRWSSNELEKMGFTFTGCDGNPRWMYDDIGISIVIYQVSTIDSWITVHKQLKKNNPLVIPSMEERRKLVDFYNFGKVGIWHSMNDNHRYI